MTTRYYAPDGTPTTRDAWLAGLRDRARRARDDVSSPALASRYNIEYDNYRTLIADIEEMQAKALLAVSS